MRIRMHPVLKYCITAICKNTSYFTLLYLTIKVDWLLSFIFDSILYKALFS